MQNTMHDMCGDKDLLNAGDETIPLFLRHESVLVNGTVIDKKNNRENSVL